jgi:hypothetical protein
VSSVPADVEAQPVGPDQLDEADLFGSPRKTRHCWCTAFCSTRTQLALGWFGGGNRAGSPPWPPPKPCRWGVLATVDDEPVGWAV